MQLPFVPGSNRIGCAGGMSSRCRGRPPIELQGAVGLKMESGRWEPTCTGRSPVGHRQGGWTGGLR